MDNPWDISVRFDTYHARRREPCPWLMESIIAIILLIFFVNLLDWEQERG